MFFADLAFLKDDTPKITCNAGCSTMSWEIIGETGQRTYDETCTLDWIDREIEVSVNGKGSCSNKVGITKCGKCDCQVNNENAFIKYKPE